jgi:AcrR family transcriptional regulator
MARQERALRTRNQLIACAAHTFRHRGFAESSLAVIRDEARVSSGALYFHFESKAALASAVVAEASRILRTGARHPDRRPVPALQRLVDVTHVLAELLSQDVVAQAGFQLSCTGHGDTEPNLRRRWHEYVTRLLVEARVEGALRADVSRRHLSAMIVATTVGFEMMGREDPAWLGRPSVTGFWTLQLPCLTTPSALRELKPEGSESPPPDLRRLARPHRA